jgi:tetratricopeptide (TPR) repeat protein
VLTARALHQLHTDQDEQYLAELVGGLADSVRRYAERLETFRIESPLRSLAMNYLAEEYQQAEEQRVVLARDDMLRPLLSGLEGNLFAAREEAEHVQNLVERNRALKKRAELARRLEEQGAYEEAIAVYQELLLQPLHSYDREHLTEKLRSLWVPTEMHKIKRDQNTRAIKYLESAKILENEGREAEALEFYAMLVQECPDSDYVQDAINRILEASRNRR